MVNRYPFWGDGRPFWKLVVSDATGCANNDYFEEVYEYYANGDAWHLPTEVYETMLILKEVGGTGVSQRSQSSVFHSNVPNRGSSQRPQTSGNSFRPNNASRTNNSGNNKAAGDEQISKLLSLIKDSKISLLMMMKKAKTCQDLDHTNFFDKVVYEDLDMPYDEKNINDKPSNDGNKHANSPSVSKNSFLDGSPTIDPFEDELGHPQDQINVEAATAIHVGDDEKADKLGANAVGINCWLWGTEVKTFSDIQDRILVPEF
ncbi:haloacid dehalogenase-like hydrolase domain-containing protein [Artemisia annua]|uniref:Haloacid dehalogenase-like hydrolase domain-containing protein n=1 Tax=Artemisia annua TaxID=35608 RepID=A0A2U1NVG1_ARTAN|nr:haloacid dehalogenase-like hydrolase domain-containing protein [Artemisia annua]